MAKEKVIPEGQGEAKESINPEVKAQIEQLDQISASESADFEPVAGGRADMPEAPGIDTAVMCTQVVDVVFSVIATRRGPHWSLQEGESSLLGNALGAVLDKYAPAYQGGPEAALVIAVLLIAGPRVAVDAKAAKLIEKQDGGANGDKGES